MRKTLKRLAAGAMLCAGLCMPAHGADPVTLQLDITVNGRQIPMRVWVSGIAEGKPPSVPAEVNPEGVIELKETENILIVKGVFTGTMEDVIRILQTYAGVRE